MLILRPGLRFLAVEQKVGADCIWNFPGGKIEPNENPRKAAVREVFEETGFMCNPRSVRHLCKRRFSVSGTEWLGHFFVYYGPLLTMEIREPEKIVDLRWLDVQEARSLNAYQTIFSDIYDYALTKLRIKDDPWINQKCVEKSSSSKRHSLEEELISVA
jgi:8-oxo-dGTP pyrophosphatase MutT (NUDIX family)